MPRLAATSDLIRVFHPDTKMHPYYDADIVIYLGPYLVFWFGFLYCIYVILPKIIIRRSKAIGEIVKA